MSAVDDDQPAAFRFPPDLGVAATALVARPRTMPPAESATPPANSIVSSSRRVAAYDPDSGKELWTVSGLTFEVIPTPVVAEGLVICSSGR